jgi:hypothetical protein
VFEVPGCRLRTVDRGLIGEEVDETGSVLVDKRDVSPELVNSSCVVVKPIVELEEDDCSSELWNDDMGRTTDKVVVADLIVLLIPAFDCVKSDRLIVWLARKLSAAGGIVDKIGEEICEIVEVVDMRADKEANADSGEDIVKTFGKEVDGKSNDRGNARGDGRGDNRGCTGFSSKPSMEVNFEVDGAVDREVDDEIEKVDKGVDVEVDMSCGLDDSTGVKLEVDEGVIGRIIEEVDEKGDSEAQEMLSKGAGREVDGEVDRGVDGVTDSEIVERPVDEVKAKVREVPTAVSGVV